MRIIFALLSLFLILACKPKNTTPAPKLQAPVLEEKIGIYKNATVYTGKTDYEFEVNGESILIEVSNMETSNQPSIPSNLITSNTDGFPGSNPLLINTKYKLEFGANQKIKSIRLAGFHGPFNPELPTIPENYSGLLSVSPTENSRAYLNISADLSTILVVSHETDQAPLVKYGRWTRSDDGSKISVQFENDIWEFLVRENALVLLSNQMGPVGMSIVTTDTFNICEYVHHWLSKLSNIDGGKKIWAEQITDKTPLSDILRTEHAYLGLYGDLELIFGVSEKRTNEILRKDPTVQGVCDLVMHFSEDGH